MSFSAGLLVLSMTAVAGSSEYQITFDVTDAEWDAAVPATDFPDWHLRLKPDRPPDGNWELPPGLIQRVTLDVVMRTDGTIGIRALKSTSDPPFAARTVSWLRKAKYKPIMKRDGKAIALRGSFTHELQHEWP